VLAAKYGIKDGHVDNEDNRLSNWWKVIYSIRCLDSIVEGRWFGDNSFRRAGDGERTLVWNDNWMNEIHLKSQFNRLFELSLDRDNTMADMFRLGEAMVEMVGGDLRFGGKVVV
ncbi:cysteine-rich receptor-like protein kinase, partial [Trifolium pratense]